MYSILFTLSVPFFLFDPFFPVLASFGVIFNSSYQISSIPKVLFQQNRYMNEVNWGTQTAKECTDLWAPLKKMPQGKYSSCFENFHFKKVLQDLCKASRNE